MSVAHNDLCDHTEEVRTSSFPDTIAMGSSLERSHPDPLVIGIRLWCRRSLDVNEQIRVYFELASSLSRLNRCLNRDGQWTLSGAR